MKVKLCTYLTNVKPQILFPCTPFEDNYTKQYFEVINRVYYILERATGYRACL